MAKKKAEKKESGFDLVAWNKGFPMQPVFVGDQVSIYKTPCKQVREVYKGIVTKVIRPALNGYWVEVQPLGKEFTTIEYIYCGKPVPYETKLS